MISRFHRAVALTVAVGALAACTDSDKTIAPNTGLLTLQMTNAPADRIQSAMVWVSRVYLIGGSDTTGAQINISTTPTPYDLLNFQDGVTTTLGTANIPVGTYTQMRMVVDSARVTLKSPLTFTGGSATQALMVPSGQQTGVKVVFGTPLTITPGQNLFVANVDVSRSFVLTGPTNAPTGAIFKPVIHATMNNVAASFAGSISPANSRAQIFAINPATNDTLGTTLADSVTGTYTLRYLPAGAYTLKAMGTSVGSTLNVSKALTLRASQDTVGVNFP